MSAERLPLDNSHEFIYTGSRYNAGTGANENATGLTGLEAWLSDEDGGVTIHADLRKSLAARASKAHEYTAVVDGDVLRLHMADRVGSVVFEVFGDGTTVLLSTPLLVDDVRRP